MVTIAIASCFTPLMKLSAPSAEWYMVASRATPRIGAWLWRATAGVIVTTMTHLLDCSCTQLVDLSQCCVDCSHSLYTVRTERLEELGVGYVLSTNEQAEHVTIITKLHDQRPVSTEEKRDYHAFWYKPIMKDMLSCTVVTKHLLLLHVSTTCTE